MTIEEKHERCAFCKTVPDEYRDGRIYNVFCRNAHCAIYGHRINIDKWNTRASDDAIKNLGINLNEARKRMREHHEKLEKCLEFIKKLSTLETSKDDVPEAIGIYRGIAQISKIILEELGELSE